MYELNNAFRQEKNKSANSPIYLYTIHAYNGADSLHLAEYDADITFNAITYQKFPIKHDEIAENSGGEIDTVHVSVSNVNRLIQTYLEQYDFRGKKVTIKLVWKDKLDDPDAFMDFVFYIDTYTASEQSVDFTLSSKFDVLSVELPFGRYNRNYCRWKFKSIECGYVGAQVSCDKRRVTCRDVMENILRYGGFPSIPTTRVFV